MKTKNKYNIKILFLMYFLTTLIVMYCFQSWMYAFILIPIGIYFILIKANTKIYFFWLITILISISLGAISYLYPNNIYDFNEFLESTDFYTGRNYLINKIDHIYKNEYTKEFIKLLMFNSKNYYGDFYKSISNLGITYLFVISGMHISFLLMPMKKIFNKKPIYYYLFGLLICLVYAYILEFSVSVLRILLSFMIILITKNKVKNFISTIISGWILMILFNRITYSASFLMSYLSTLLIMWMSKKIQNKIILYFSINIFCFLLTIPIILNFNNKINIFVFFYNILFSNMIMFIYIYLLIFCFVPPMVEITDKIIFFIQNLINSSNITSIFININKTYAWSNSLFYIGFLGIFSILNKKK